ncbi:MAG: DUF1007 family protein [Pseudomonadota bacterium]
MIGTLRTGCAAGVLSLALIAQGASSHPHVFVDGGVDVVIRDGSVLEALEVTWLYDPFESLYILASLGVIPDARMQLSDADRARLIAHEADWSDGFTGSAHLSVAGSDIPLARPVSFDVHLTGDRLQVTFRRDLLQPVDLSGRAAEIAFYEATYFYAFSATHRPEFLGPATECSTDVIHFDPDEQAASLQATLFDLSREETPSIDNVGALFADRIVFQCA